MSSFEQTNPFWQLQQLERQVSETVEQVLTHGNTPNPSDWVLPDWALRSLFWLLLLVVITWLGWQLYPLLKTYLQQVAPKQWHTQHSVSEPISNLPLTQWLQRSRHYALQHNYREACRCLYQASLQHLHHNKLIAQQPSRTDGEYLQLLQNLPNSEPYQVLIRTHEKLCFNNAEISAQEFNRCQRFYQEIDSTTYTLN